MNRSMVDPVVGPDAGSVAIVGSHASTNLEAATKRSETGHILAVFSRCCYISLPLGPLCLGEVTIGGGPINALLAEPQAWHCLRTQLRAGLPCAVSNDQLMLPGRAITYSNAAVKRYCVSDGILAGESVLPAERICSLARLAPSESLSAMMSRSGADFDSASDSALQRSYIDFMQPLLRRFAADLQTELLCADANSVSATVCRQLVGAGNGLTPAGDDLLAGVMLALHITGRTELAQSLYQHLKPILAHNTNPVSAALLHQAAQAQAAESVLQLFFMLGDATEGAEHALARRLNRMGHTSGWDMLAGIALVARAQQAISQGDHLGAQCRQRQYAQFNRPLLKA